MIPRPRDINARIATMLRQQMASHYRQAVYCLDHGDQRSPDRYGAPRGDAGDIEFTVADRHGVKTRRISRDDAGSVTTFPERHRHTLEVAA